MRVILWYTWRADKYERVNVSWFSITFIDNLALNYPTKMNPNRRKVGDSIEKKLCPYSENCYRKNPIHFTEMSHPHLEKLVMDQLDGIVSVPSHLDFECSDRSTLLDQLRILQMILKKERDSEQRENGVNGCVDAKATTQPKTVISEDLKEKIERNKKMAAERRDAKLKELDRKSAILRASSTSKDNDDASDKLAARMERQRLGGSDDSQTASTSKRTVGSTNFDQRTESSKRFKNETNEKHEKEAGSKSRKEGHKNGASPNLAFQHAASGGSAAREKIRLEVIERLRKTGSKMSIVEPGEFALKYALSAPYHYFLTRVENSKETYDQKFSLAFPEVLDKSLGEIACSLQINFMVDAGWLIAQYLLAAQRANMTILYGERVDTETLPPTIKMINIKMPAFGCHHSKLMVLKYTDDALRVVVSTANLYSDDWENRTQGVWISPHLPRLLESANSSDGESPTGFKKDFERYLQKYNFPDLAEWTCAVRRADFSAVNVFFVASVPGSHKDIDQDAWGHRKLSSILSKHVTMPANAPEWPIVAQCSSIGSLGPNYESWLSKEIIPALCREKNQGLKSHPRFQFIYPSIANYKSSFDMRTGSSCLPYSMATHQKQLWLESYLFQWKAERTHRNRAIPHIKTYTRISPDLTEIPWFVLTSANLSKAAWGYRRGNHYIMSYEAGVIFVPKFVTGKSTFNIKADAADGTPKFLIPYDLPLTRYTSRDKPFVSEFFQGYE